MKRLDKRTVKGFVTGVLASVLVATTIAPAAASALREIRVSMGGIKIYVDGNLKKPTDAKGNVVEPLIYDGTTYLPVRACVGMLTDKEVSWDGNTETVYIGKRPDAGAQSVTLDTLKPYAENTYKTTMLTGKDAQFSILGETNSPFNRLSFSASHDSGNDTYYAFAAYKLNSNYMSINGKLVVAYDRLGNTSDPTLSFYNVDQYGEETLMKQYTVKAGDAPIDISLNVSGCNFIKIRASGASYQSKLCFYDITLTTAE